MRSACLKFNVYSFDCMCLGGGWNFVASSLILGWSPQFLKFSIFYESVT